MAESEELRRFREDWKREVQARTHPEPVVVPPSTSNTEATVTRDALDVPVVTKSAELVALGPIVNPTVTITTPSNGRQSALELYAQAIGLEEQGAHDAAAQLYRRAFRLDGNVDRAYHRLQLRRELDVGGLVNDVGALSLASGDQTRSNAKDSTAKSHITSHIQPLHAYGTFSASKGALADLLPSFLNAKFEPEDERQALHIKKLPDELLLAILSHFIETADTRAIERFGSVSRKARLLTLEQGIWRQLVERTYVPPQLSIDPLVLLPSFREDYRQFYIHQPRVRMDGVYIAVCHYVRTGHTENAWVNITHLITYHRYLRFLPGGIVLSLLSSDSTLSPQQIIPLLTLENATLASGGQRVKGLSMGQWELHTVDESGGSKGPDGPYVTIDNILDSSHGSAPKYAFSMRLGLRSKPVGRWNKLDILNYSSIRIATDEETPLLLKHERPYWFSKVRSYGSGMDPI
ncbi:related to F-box protein pof7 [Serendipita indica DSM 11827]|uniref:Related to F-box protein pof7 n=1 Tax=Serendipita indica (strain DSM 11827) TaxID=1109443 RepID=G4TIL6_SERID|nr:related to F-box protein pof7 [Serendipita indica DSM 11827]